MLTELEEKKEILLKGISGGPGICIGKAYLVDREGVDVIPQYNITRDMRAEEVKRFKNAVHKAKNELIEIIESTPDALKDHIQIMEAHLILFNDKMLYARTIKTIEEEGVNAEWALKTVVADTRSIFQQITDPYLKSRSDDIAHVSERIMRNLLGAEEENIGNISKRVILVAKDLSPAQTSQIQLEWIKGFITDQGGTASHTSIIARSLGIPCVQGLENARKIISNDDIVIVDGIKGQVIVNPDDETIILYEERKHRFEEHRASIFRISHLPSITRDNMEVKVMGNIELAEEVVSVKDHDGDGIGLLRTEFLYMNRRSFPEETELFEQYKEVLELMAPAGVTLRTLDINGDKAIDYSHTIKEINPALGLRAIRFCLKKKEVFKTQLRAILRAAVYGEARIMLPMISCLEEVLEAKEVLRECQEELREEELLFNPDVPLGIMIEVPSAVVIADILAKEVDFFSIGTNDLVQYLMAIDRDNPQVAHLYNSLNPAVLRMIRHVAEEAEKAGISVSMCGEMAGDPFNIPILMGLGIKELSMSPQSIPTIKNIVRQLDSKECKSFIDSLLKEKCTTKNIKKAIKNNYGDLISLHFS